MVKDDAHSIPSSGQIMYFGLSFSPTGMMCVLSRLHARPEMAWKFFIYFVACLKLSGVRVMKSVVSSAKFLDIFRLSDLDEQNLDH